MHDEPQITDTPADTVPVEGKPKRAAHTIRTGRRTTRLEGWHCALLAGLALFPGLAGATTLVLYLADWPAKDNGAAQFGVGLSVGVAAWFLLSLIFCRALTHPESANSDIYGELSVRVTSLDVRLAHIRAENKHHEKREGVAEREALAQVKSHHSELRRELNLAEDSGRLPERAPGSCLRWLLGSGYVNAWRHVHRAEEALLELEPKETVYVAAMTDRARLQASSIEGSKLLAEKLGKLLGEGESAQQTRPGNGARAGGASPQTTTQQDDAHMAELLARLNQPQARALLRESRYTLNKHRNGLWDQLVHLRNLLFATMVFTGIVAYAVLALAVVAEANPSSVTAAVAFYLVGAVVGLFGELYATSRRKSGVVNDYGLALVRLLTIPLLSGIAAVGGVLLTRLAGSASDSVPALTDIFSLSEYPAGLVVAAIFGLTPGLLLERLRAQTEEYKEEIARSGVGGEQQSGESAASQTPT